MLEARSLARQVQEAQVDEEDKEGWKRQSPCCVPRVTSILAVSPNWVLTLTHAPAWACLIVSTSSGFIPMASR
eukprot:439951-Rhodomonas_salina.1